MKNKSKEAEQTTILVVDDDGDIRIALEMLLTYEGFSVWTAKNGEEALARLDQALAGDGPRPALVLTDLKMPGMDGLELLEAIGEREGAPPVILISGHGDVATAVDAMNRGARNFLEKPLDENRVLVTLRGVLREDLLRQENTGLKRLLCDRWELVGESPAMETLRDQVRRVAASDAAVLITGENGTGKEVVARNLHLAGPRATGPFITVNCAAIPAELIESELFGHEKGSFTGATGQRTGHFEAASGGTLFLDEIGDMPLAAQAKVLRALESHEITRVGDSQTIPVDIRVLAATNANLEQAVEDTNFRMDLFYRLNVVPLVVPPLRERLGDVPALARLFLERLAERGGHRPGSLAPPAEALLCTLNYPGNVRQLRNLIEGASVFAQGEQIEVADLEEVLGGGLGPGKARRASGADPFQAQTFEEFKNESEALFFRQKLAENGDNVKQTAENLGMQRSHIYKKLSRYGLR
ncbi:MAG: sigma-54 dependent transcriptional regulator [Planctomycetota bacterium]|nr:sigma-54 dependent transcriptional regulator [Planctomycetota bacterium]MDP6838894.1 sigma-54 dependent transcriptional regulator [Planctomycetota bacterium]